ncbi:hypothetical protein TraAM80_04824 [Trypanosoma rangeli]|uniref:Uncharacterized protein n=1 Tax=Trypanosoma rangeli TaxID=5698 RepID=A0A422NHN3_TRYRA|nr:uncharacterized protein TraAM80_04824 [Trypanosoma rangeli]RNF04988.1 hypothetical protein TraAM80_04824 [Trypanosoma rangeli]|eukprot:RNF04988.1 hypothetical protein TraAM80_04824 [Trypanosoma rangeli]
MPVCSLFLCFVFCAIFYVGASSYEAIGIYFGTILMNVVFSLVRAELNSSVIALLVVVFLLCMFYCLRRAPARRKHHDTRKPAMSPVHVAHDTPRVKQLMGKYEFTVRVRACDAMLRRLPPEVCFRLRLYLSLILSIVSWNPRQVVTVIYRGLDVVRIWNARCYTERTAAICIRNWKHTSLSGDAVPSHTTGKRGGWTSAQAVIAIWLD